VPAGAFTLVATHQTTVIGSGSIDIVRPMTGAREAFDQRDWEAVVRATTAVGTGVNQSVESLRLRGWALYHLGRYEEALDVFSEILKLEPSTTDAALGRGRCYRMLGRVDDAAAEFSLAHRLSPTDPHPLCERGAVLILDERWDEALADYQAAEALDPSHPGLASYFAELYLYSGRPDEALAAARRGLEREPASVMHRVNLAHALLFTGQQEEALTEYRAAQDKIASTEHVSGAAIALNDFALMRDAGLMCDGLDEVAAMLRAELES
jgi:tetratricopeptide (TPR) repeat protein